MKKSVLAALLSLFIMSAVVAPSLSQQVIPGVAAGDWFMYMGFFSHNTTSPSLEIPERMVPYTFWIETDSITYTVIVVTGPTVTFEATWEFKNGTTVVKTAVENVANPVNYLCIGAGMEPDDEFLADDGYGSGPLQINSTVIFDFPDFVRDVNYHASNTTAEALFTRQYWFDKQCGFLLSQKLAAIQTAGADNATTKFQLELIDSNVIPEFPTGTAMLLVFVAVTVCVDIYRRKRLKHRNS